LFPGRDAFNCCHIASTSRLSGFFPPSSMDARLDASDP
jgi:hypothetical protein